MKGLSRCKNLKELGIYLASRLGIKIPNNKPYKHTFIKMNNCDFDIPKIQFRKDRTLYPSRQKTRPARANSLSDIIVVLVCTAMVVFIGWSLLRGIDSMIESQDRMLCESAKISGNKEYLEKCECYYQTGDIKCLSR